MGAVDAGTIAVGNLKMAKQLRAAVVQPPSLQQLADISNRLGLDIPEEDLPQYRGQLCCGIIPNESMFQ